MMPSMFAGVSGLRNHQVRMDVIGNNIANVNTVGFKASRVTFRQLFSQTLRGASRPTQDRAGTNPVQIGLGMTLGSITPSYAPGNPQVTGVATHMAIDGNGFFILRDGGSRVYTRAGDFGLDAEGYLSVPSSGLRVQGWLASGGTLPALTPGNLKDIQIRVGEPIAAQATTQVAFADNLDARAAVNDTKTVVIDVYDSLGNVHPVTVIFEKTGTNAWQWTADWAGAAGTEGSGTLTFNPDGSLATQTGGPVSFTPPGANPVSVALDFSRVTQFAADYSVQMLSRDGYPSGVLDSFTIDSQGVITGSYSNGVQMPIAQVALASFANPAGLIDLGGGLLAESNNSGSADIAAPGTGGLGTILPSALEMSNVDLGQEFTDMIITQRGFQANSRIITTADEMLQELVNLRR